MTELISILLAFIIGALIVYITIPVIVKISNVKKLLDFPDRRKVNVIPTPNLGGVALFIGISIASFLSLCDLSFPELRYIMIGVIIMLFIGIKDDILVLSARKKFLAQLIAALLIIIPGDIRFTNLHGVFGVFEIDYVTSLFVSAVALVAIINAVNLIDGIDGLATSIGLLASLSFGLLFLSMNHLEYGIVCFAMIGSLVVFFAFNVFGKRNKIFMGDTGSLIIGLLVAVFVIRFNEFALNAGDLYYNFSPVLSLAIVSLPLFDMLRVFVVRIICRKSPFAPDRNHIHHKLLFIGKSHLQSTLILIIVNILLIGAAFIMRNLNVNLQLVLFTSLVALFSFLPNIFIITHKERKQLLRGENTTLIMDVLGGFIQRSDYFCDDISSIHLDKNDIKGNNMITGVLNEEVLN
jgi:UDP-N-acetylmuramyl pentapeptide phosphotransferase/UDP-N-acetylglucosamine-1-phosphate transferase